jgi:uncharacterized protein YbaR (Trm112 family)
MADVQLAPLLIEVLVCPQDHGPLTYLAAESVLYNPRLRRRYRIRDGIPVMLIDEAEAVDDAEHARLVALGGVQTGPSASGGR